MGDFDRFQKLVDSVNSHHKNVFLPKGKLKFDKHQTDSCFTIHEHIDNSVQKHYHTFIDPKKVDECNLHSSEELILRFKGNDKIIINNWLNICILAENETVFFFKTLMNKRIIVIRHKSDLYKAKSNFLKYKKELEDLLKKAKNNNDQVNVNIYSKKINDINNKLFENKKRLVDNEQQHLEAIKCEKIWWLTYSINKLKDTKDSKLSDILKKQVKLKETLESVDYFANRKSRLKIIEDKMIVYTNAEKYLQGKKHFKKEDSLAKRSISKQIKILTDERKTIYNEIGHKISFIDVRNILKPKIDKLIQKSKIDGNNNTQIKKHILDESVGQVCESVKSMITNYNNKNIFSFTLRYRKQNKISKNLQLEKEFFKKGSMFGKIFKDVECKKDGKKYDIFDVINKKTTCNLVYDDDRNRYSLYVPQQVEAKTNIKKGYQKRINSNRYGFKSICNMYDRK